MKRLLLVLLLSGCGFTSIIEEKQPNFMETAYYYLGYTEMENTKELKAMFGFNPRYTEWCAAFVNTILETSGYESLNTTNYPYPLIARGYLEYGEPLLEDELRYGDIMVFTRGNSKWKGHVGFYVGQEKIKGKTYYRILGGNQSNEVNISLYPRYRLLGIRRPF